MRPHEPSGDTVGILFYVDPEDPTHAWRPSRVFESIEEAEVAMAVEQEAHPGSEYHAQSWAVWVPIS